MQLLAVLCSLQDCSDVAELGHSCDVSANPTLRQQAESTCHRLLENPFTHCHLRVSGSQHQSLFPDCILLRIFYITLFHLPWKNFNHLASVQWIIIPCLCILVGPSSVCRHMPVFVLQLTSKTERVSSVWHPGQLCPRVCPATCLHLMEDSFSMW